MNSFTTTEFVQNGVDAAACYEDVPTSATFVLVPDLQLSGGMISTLFD